MKNIKEFSCSNKIWNFMTLPKVIKENIDRKQKQNHVKFMKF